MDLRSSIFELTSFGPSQSLRAQVLDVCNDARPALGVKPGIGFVGRVETVESSLASELLTVLREALANVGRHARAKDVMVTVSADEALVLEVADDGIGIRDGESLRRGNGLDNMKARAEKLGGTFAVAPRERGGTRLEWRVPLP